MPNNTYHPRGELVEGFAVQDHPLYSVWTSMKSRCKNPKSKHWNNYGGRGITVCARWEHFRHFVEDMGARPEGTEIDRINNDEGYSKENCRWATRVVNAQNKRVYRTNPVGVGGVRVKGSSFYCRYAYNGVRYNLGSFATPEEAKAFKEEFKQALKTDPGNANAMLVRRANLNSGTGIKGINRHSDGGYLVRKTVNGERLYLGYFASLKQAVEMLERAA